MSAAHVRWQQDLEEMWEQERALLRAEAEAAMARERQSWQGEKAAALQRAEEEKRRAFSSLVKKHEQQLVAVQARAAEQANERWGAARRRLLLLLHVRTLLDGRLQSVLKQAWERWHGLCARLRQQHAGVAVLVRRRRLLACARSVHQWRDSVKQRVRARRLVGRVLHRWGSRSLVAAWLHWRFLY